MFIAFDLETSGLIGDRKPKGEPPTVITCAGIMSTQGIQQFSAPWDDWNREPEKAEKFLLENFLRIGKIFTLNVVCTYNGKAFDFPLLEERLKHHGLPSDLGSFVHVDEMEYVMKVYGRRVSKDEAARDLADIWIPDTVRPHYFARAYMAGNVTPEIHIGMLQHNAMDLATTWRFHHVLQSYPDYQRFLVQVDEEQRKHESRKEDVEAFL